jgi:trans-aconitate methyltransferase
VGEGDALVPSTRPDPALHPDRLAVVARLHGVPATPPEQARVLDLGCGTGAHLLPLAEQLPDAHLRGIDLDGARLQVGAGLAVAAGLDPTIFAQADAREPGAIGTGWDYILANRVISRVGPVDAASVLARAAEALAPCGVLAVGFDTLPGWHLRGAVRQLLLQHVAPFDDDATRVGQARALLGFLASQVPAHRPAWRRLLEEERDRTASLSDPDWLDDMLAPTVFPWRIDDVVAAARRVGLRYLGDASWSHVHSAYIADGALAALRGIAGDDPIALEQAIDLFTNRYYRAALFVRADLEPHAEPDASKVADLWVHARLSLQEGAPDPHDPAPVVYASPNDEALTVQRPVAKALLASLAASRGDRPARAIAEEAERRVGAAWTDADTAGVWDRLVRLTANRDLSLVPRDRRYQSQASTRPLASGLARAQARLEAPSLTSGRHEPVPADALDHLLVPLLDGTRDHAALRAHLVEALASGALQARDEDGRPPRPEARAAVAADALTTRLEELASAGMLLA